MRPTNGCELMFDGLIGADSVRHRRIGAGSSSVWGSNPSRTLSSVPWDMVDFVIL
jgi:hypothetical protein